MVLQEPISLPRFRHLSSFLPEVASKNPEKVAIIWESERITYGELLNGVSRTASSLRRIGLKKGDRVGTMMKNSTEMVYVWLGSLMAGCVFVPFNTGLKGDFLAYQIKDSRPSVIFVDGELVQNIPENVIPETRLVVRGGQEAGNHEKFEKFILEGEESFVPEQVSPSDPAQILYTSGTTDKPKGVVLPHYSFVNRAREVSSIILMREDDVLFNCLPFFHTSGQVMTTLPALLSGLTTAQMDWFHVSRFWNFASKTCSTVSFLLMRMVNLLLNAPKNNYAPNMLRVIMCGGVSAPIQRRFMKRFGVQLVEGYGMTETCGIAIFNTVYDNKVGSIGKPLRSVLVKLVDERGKDVGIGRVGEIAIKERMKNTIFLSYLNSPSPFDKLGWFLTGDLAKRDKEGYYYYVERKKDIIRSRGENIIPSQIESVAELFPGVVEAAATGVYSKDTGDEEILLAIRTSGKIDYGSFVDFLRQELPFYMIPRFIIQLETLPKTANQKVKRSELKKLDKSKAFDVREVCRLK